MFACARHVRGKRSRAGCTPLAFTCVRLDFLLLVGHCHCAMVPGAAFCACADPCMAGLPVYLLVVEGFIAGVVKGISTATSLVIAAGKRSKPGNTGQRKAPYR